MYVCVSATAIVRMSVCGSKHKYDLTTKYILNSVFSAQNNVLIPLRYRFTIFNISKCVISRAHAGAHSAIVK